MLNNKGVCVCVCACMCVCERETDEEKYTSQMGKDTPDGVLWDLPISPSGAAPSPWSNVARDDWILETNSPQSLEWKTKALGFSCAWKCHGGGILLWRCTWDSYWMFFCCLLISVFFHYNLKQYFRCSSALHIFLSIVLFTVYCIILLWG
jgi:hypothetical protein